MKPSMESPTKTKSFLLVGTVVLTVLTLCSFFAGKYPLTLSGLLSGDAMQWRVFLTLRAIGGFVLGVTGFVYQTVFRNPLASPDIIGASSGASVGAAFGILFLPGAVAVTLSAFAGAICCVLLALTLSSLTAEKDGKSIVLSGIAVHSLAQTALVCLKLLADPEKQLASIEYWIMGSLNGISLYAKPGQKIAFVGSTGAGKTTIINLINRFYEVNGGSITYDGIDIREIRKDDLRRSMSMVIQDTHLFTGTIADNIRYGRLDASDEDVRAAAQVANAHSFIRRLPQGYDTVLHSDGANLSQGQRQLLAIARAAISRPPVLILDEATSSIDTRTEKLIEQGMDALMEGRTVFVIAHRLSTVRRSEAIIVLEHGEIMERGDHDELLEQKGRYYQLYTGQFELD